MVSAAPACRSRRTRRVSAGVALLVTAALAVGLTPLASADPPTTPSAPIPDAASTPGTYIVTLADAPIAAYNGGVAGLKATRPTDGRRVQTTSSNATRYRSYLQKRQNSVAARVGVSPKSRYEISLSAFTAKMSTQQAKTLAKTPGVVSVTKDVMRHHTDDRNSVDYLGLSGRNGVWSTLGGTAKSGRGVVVGVLDSGIWPESASFAGSPLKHSSRGKYVPYRSGGDIVMTKSDGSTFAGKCQTGVEFTRADCTTKIVGARYFGDAWMANVAPKYRRDYISPRDGGGHGSHTASTAAGNNGVQAVVQGRDFGKISGVAPAAKIAVYKVLWEGDTEAHSGGYNSDILKAIDAAVRDGVDVINYSISGSDDPTDPIELAFLSAASAGIFVATSAGNSGPDPSTTAHTSPWLTSVAASTVQSYDGTVTLGNGQKYAGVSTSVTTPVGPAPLANASALAVSGAPGTNATLCAPGSLDPAKAAGKIVVCDRGVVDRVAKSAEVKRAGGIGMVLANLTENSLDGDLHSVPTVHVNPPASTAIKTYANTAGATATLTEGNQTAERVPYPQIAGFSSRGPSLGTDGDTLKPDITAPGVAILAAVAPPSNSNRNFDFYSGTSMASPHVAGLAALFYGVGVHPRWSPMRVKSALMTTATDLVDADGKRFTDPYAQGAGEVAPGKMLDPGLVYPAGDRDWLGYLAGLGVDTRVKAIDPSDYNSASIAIGTLLQRQTVTRRVTAVKPGIYHASASIPGVKVTVSPSILNFNAKGETKRFRVSFDNRSADFDEAASGFLTWKGAGSRVRIPMVVTPSVVDAPDEVSGVGASGRISYTVTPGVAGSFPITASGLVAGTAQDATKPAGESAQFDATVPSGAKVAQFTARTANVGADLDLDLYRVENGVKTLVAQSATSATNETIVLKAPPAGKYIGVVNVFANAPNTSTTALTFRAAAVTSGAGLGNFAVSPANPRATIGQPIRLTASWSGLSAGTPYLGWVEYKDGSGTIVTVN
jgi:hypothetical protein